MTTTDQFTVDDFARVFAMVEGAFPRAGLTRASLAAYYEALRDLPPRAVAIAARQLVISMEFCPTASQWRAEAQTCATFDPEDRERRLAPREEAVLPFQIPMDRPMTYDEQLAVHRAITPKELRYFAPQIHHKDIDGKKMRHQIEQEHFRKWGWLLHRLEFDNRFPTISTYKGKWGPPPKHCCPPTAVAVEVIQTTAGAHPRPARRTTLETDEPFRFDGELP